MTFAPKLLYRPEIDGLRAIAVVSVVLYHVEELFGQEIFNGGYIGVDIFFVISGYLITRIILVELYQTGRINFLKFYERRARRIIPVLLVVVLASIPFGWKTLLPADFLEFSNSILASLTFVSNFFFYLSAAEYGANSALLKPFLHTWSLAVEEQFYLIFPIIALVTYRYMGSRFVVVFLILSVLSLGFAEYMQVRNAMLNFFLPFSRFWELAAGAFLAYVELNRGALNKSRIARYLPGAGLALVLFSLCIFNSYTAHPSVHTLIPVTGVMLMIAFASDTEPVGRFLSTRPFVGVGLISYSLYLWHFPIFAFARLQGDFATTSDKLSAILLTVVLSICSYALVEKPFRKRTLVSGQLLVLTLVFGTLSLIAGGLLSQYTDGFEKRFAHMENYSFDQRKLRIESWSIVKNEEINNFDQDNDKPNVLIVGNSHAKDTLNAFAQNIEFRRDFNFSRIGTTADFQLRCLDATVDGFNEYRMAFYNDSRYQDADLLIISTNFNHKPHPCKSNREYEGLSTDIEGIRNIVRRAREDEKRVIIMGQHVEFETIGRVPWTDTFLVKNAEKKLTPDLVTQMNRKLFKVRTSKHSKRDLILAELAKRLGVPFFPKVDFICGRLSCYGIIPDGSKAFYDGSHWTLAGARFFGSRMLGSDLHQCMLGKC